MMTEEQLEQNAKVGYRIKLWRTRKKVSQKKLAEELKISQAYLAMLEAGTRTLTALQCKALADTFGISPEELLK